MVTTLIVYNILMNCDEWPPTWSKPGPIRTTNNTGFLFVSIRNTCFSHGKLIKQKKLHITTPLNNFGGNKYQWFSRCNCALCKKEWFDRHFGRFFGQNYQNRSTIKLGETATADFNFITNPSTITFKVFIFYV